MPSKLLQRGSSMCMPSLRGSGRVFARDRIPQRFSHTPWFRRFSTSTDLFTNPYTSVSISGRASSRIYNTTSLDHSDGEVRVSKLPTASFPDEAVPTSSGYLPVSLSSESKLFYCYYEARSANRPANQTPVLLWLNGGPGCSSMIGNFYSLGPFIVQGVDSSVEFNRWSWNSKYGVIFIDNPIGTGFSLATSTSEIPLDQAKCAEHLLHALVHFFSGNPKLRGRPLFLTGESYAGKYIPALACHILAQNTDNLPFAFSGVAIGNGFTHPRTQVQVHAQVMQSFGMLDERQVAYVDKEAQAVVALVEREEWVEAHHRRTKLCEWMEQSAGIPTLLDIRRHAKYHATEDGVEFLALFLNRPDVKAAIKAEPGVTWVSCRPDLRLHMACDTMKSYKHLVERLLQQHVPTLLFQGMFDAKDGPLSTEMWIKEMTTWEGLPQFLAASRSIWRGQHTGGKLAGYVRNFGSLTNVVLVGAGHQVPADQPENALEMIETWVEEQLPQPTNLA